jgi:hypothetical protein
VIRWRGQEPREATVVRPARAVRARPHADPVTHRQSDHPVTNYRYDTSDLVTDGHRNVAQQRRRYGSVNEGDIGMTQAGPLHLDDNPTGKRGRVVHVVERERLAVTKELPCLQAATS